MTTEPLVYCYVQPLRPVLDLHPLRLATRVAPRTKGATDGCSMMLTFSLSLSLLAKSLRGRGHLLTPLIP